MKARRQIHKCFIRLVSLCFLLFPTICLAQNVYITKTGTKYHQSTCGYLSNSKIEVTLNVALERGYTPCSRCSSFDLISNRKLQPYNSPTHFSTNNKRTDYDFIIPKCSDNNQVIYHYAYCLSYDEEYEQAKWVAYIITSDKTDVKVKRKNNFRIDPMVKTGSADDLDYKKGGYDRGHLVPAADMSWSEISMSESFYYSNMSPQEPSFNRGIWKSLEEQVRRWLYTNDTLFVVTGPVLKPGLRTIGYNNVAVPEQFYKVVLDYSEPGIKAIGFLIPNRKSMVSLYNFTVPIDSIEQVTGIDFFPQIPDELENKLESNNNKTIWE